MALVTIQELAARLPFEMDADDEREAIGSLDDLSEDAAIYGSSKWTDIAATPQAVKNLILRAAARHMKNYEGYIQSRAGDETVEWNKVEDGSAGTATFTDDEKKTLRMLGGGGSFIGTVPIAGWGNAKRDLTGYVPSANGGSNFPLYADTDGPW